MKVLLHTHCSAPVNGTSWNRRRNWTKLRSSTHTTPAITSLEMTRARHGPRATMKMQRVYATSQTSGITEMTRLWWRSPTSTRRHAPVPLNPGRRLRRERAVKPVAPVSLAAPVNRARRLSLGARTSRARLDKPARRVVVRLRHRVPPRDARAAAAARRRKRRRVPPDPIVAPNPRHRARRLKPPHAVKAIGSVLAQEPRQTALDRRASANVNETHEAVVSPMLDVRVGIVHETPQLANAGAMSHSQASGKPSTKWSTLVPR